MAKPTSPMVRWIQDMYLEHGVAFPVIMWTVWRARNMKVFDNKVDPLSAMQVRVSSLCFFISRAYADDKRINPGTDPPRTIAWQHL